MAPKRASPLDERPTASSSEEEEEEEEGSSEEQVGSSDELEEEEQHEPTKPSSPPPPPVLEKKPTSRRPPPASTNSHARASSSESGSESHSGSDSEDERPSVALDSKHKPAASKPMEETPKAKKPRSQSSATPTRSAKKRVVENSLQVNDSNRNEKKSSHSEAEAPARGKTVDDSKKLFQRLWSEDDEIAILKGMDEYSAKNGADPHKDPNAFHDFIKKSLHVDVSKVQLMDKIRRLKKKYQNNAGKGTNGEDLKFSKAHDKKAFEFSKKIWGTEGTSGVTEQKSNVKARKDIKECSGSRSGTVASLKADLLPSPNSNEAGKVDMDQSSGSILSLCEMIQFHKNLGMSRMNEDIMKKGWELIGASKREELDNRWKKLQVAEFEIYVKRIELFEEQAKLIWEAHKSSNH